MVFSSLLFLFRFLPAVLIVYYLAGERYRNLVLFLFSLVFYAWGEPVYLILMLAAILITYTGGRLVDHFREQDRDAEALLSMVISVCMSLSLLIYFKYADFAISSINSLTGADIPLLNVALPIGISFYTFQSLSYVIDVYRGDALVQKNLISYGTYVTMFPQLIAGPIVQYQTIDRQLRERHENAPECAEGICRFMTGLGKKVLIANNAGALWDYIRVMDPSTLPAAMAWMGIIAYTFQIYFDFSAYSDMAIGLGHMFGFTFLENFNYPYMAKSITQFWRRWHISLSTWFRDYVYIPLGGNRHGRKNLVRNMLIVWLLTGIWHGAAWNFLIWGLYYGILLIIEKLFLGERVAKLPSVVQHLYTLIAVVFGWLIFAYGDIASGTGYVRALFCLASNPAGGGETLYLLYNHGVLLAAAAVGCTDLPARTGRRIMRALGRAGGVKVVVSAVWIIGLFVLCTAYLVNASYNPFLYFRF